MQRLFDLLIDLIKWIFDFLRSVAESAIGKFQEINLFEKLIVVNTIAAFFAIVLPMARYFIFETYFTINNPLAVHLIGIVVVMFAAMYFPGLKTFIAREALNAYYLGWVIYIGAAREISKAPYEITFGYYLNLIVPAIYMVLSFLSFIVYRD
ncbi:MAG: hypothetical protein MUD12_12365 [Spirochaetes bacterium]|jgi:hypothetical protein|nr:hypothetical protein [Spirochaetota bacterium]